MVNNKLKINETVLVVIILLIIAAAILFVSQRNKGTGSEIFAEDNQQNSQVELSTYAQAYEASPLDRDTVYEYTRTLILLGRNEEAYIAIDKYFKETPKEKYSQDIEMWMNHALASLSTKRCLVATADGWHIQQNSAVESREYIFGGSVAHQALNEKGCIK